MYIALPRQQGTIAPYPIVRSQYFCRFAMLTFPRTMIIGARYRMLHLAPRTKRDTIVAGNIIFQHFARSLGELRIRLGRDRVKSRRHPPTLSSPKRRVTTIHIDLAGIIFPFGMLYVNSSRKQSGEIYQKKGKVRGRKRGRVEL